LVMFMKNLLRKRLLPVQEMAFDLEEICVRFIWIVEVRDFRKFLEGEEYNGDGNFGAQGVSG